MSLDCRQLNGINLDRLDSAVQFSIRIRIPSPTPGCTCWDPAIPTNIVLSTTTTNRKDGE